MRIYYCECGTRIEVLKGKSEQCKCGKVFGNGANFKTSNHVNMRTTWSGQTQVEFTKTTMGQDIIDRGGTW